MLSIVIFSIVYIIFGGLLGLLVYDKYIKNSENSGSWWASLVVMEVIIFCILVLPAILDVINK